MALAGVQQSPMYEDPAMFRSLVEAATRGHEDIVLQLMPAVVHRLQNIRHDDAEDDVQLCSLVGIDEFIPAFLRECVHSELYDLLNILLGQCIFLSRVRVYDEHTLLWFITNHVTENKEHEAVSTVRTICEELRRGDNFAEARSSILLAASRGLVDIIHRIVWEFPAAISSVDQNNMTIFHLAVKHRHLKVFNLVYQLTSYRDVFVAVTNLSGNNILHEAARLPLDNTVDESNDPVLKMQEELLWFEAVKKIVPAAFESRKNDDGKTPWMLFTEQHKVLVEQAEKRMKEMSHSFTVVAALISAVGLAASIAVAGGVTSDSGHPVRDKSQAFRCFYSANSVSMFLALAVVLLFLSVLTYRMGQRSFMRFYPTILIIGNSLLLVAVLSQAIAFFAGTYLLEGGKTVIELVVCSVVMGAFLLKQLPILVKLCVSTYGRSKFCGRNGRFVY